MSYLELYIGGSCNQDPIVSGMNMYLLPGLIDYHTTSSTNDVELLEWKKEYNCWLGIVRKEYYRFKTDETLSDKERGNLKYNLEYWAWLMYELRQKIGRYTNKEVLGGFKLE